MEKQMLISEYKISPRLPVPAAAAAVYSSRTSTRLKSAKAVRRSQMAIQLSPPPQKWKWPMGLFSS